MDENKIRQIAMQVATQVYQTLGTQYGVSQTPAHIHDGIGSNLLPLTSVTGYFQQVIAIPTDTPNIFQNSIALNTTTGALYYFDYTNKVWKTVGSASILAGNGTMSGGVLDITHAGITSSSVCVATRHGSADSSGFPQIATGYTSGTTMRIFEGTFTKTWSIDYIIYF